MCRFVLMIGNGDHKERLPCSSAFVNIYVDLSRDTSERRHVRLGAWVVVVELLTMACSGWVGS